MSMPSDGISLKSTTPDSFELPVCRGAHIVVVDFETNKKHTRDFPCACGGWRADQTAGFLNATGFGQNSASYKQKWASDIFQNLCPNTLRKVSAPLTFFLEMCGLGVRYPFISDAPDHYFFMEPDPRCDAFWKHTEGMDEREANIKFCQQEWPEVKWLFKDTHRGYTIGRAGGHLPYETKCKRWMKKKEIIGWNQTQYILNMSATPGVGSMNLAHMDGFAGLPLNIEAESSSVSVVDNVSDYEEFANLLASNDTGNASSSTDIHADQHENNPNITDGNDAKAKPATIAKNGNGGEAPHPQPQTELDSTNPQPSTPEQPQANSSQDEQEFLETVSAMLSELDSIGGQELAPH